MTKGTMSAKARASVAAPAGARCRRDGAQEHADAAVPARRRSGQERPAVAELDRALAANRQQLGAALLLAETLRKQAALLSQQVVLLAHAVAQAHRFAYRDELTGLPNRRLLMDRYNQAVAQAVRQHGQVVLVFLDLDGFKRINDMLGHAAGDGILQQAATRLVECIRTSDTACRYGGDEFVVLLPEYEGQDSAAAVVEKIRRRLAAPFDVDGKSVSVTASIGMAVYPVDGHEYGALIHASDRAMYRHKARSAVLPSGPGAGLSNWCRADGIDLDEEHRDEAGRTGTRRVREEPRTGTGKSLQ